MATQISDGRCTKCQGADCESKSEASARAPRSFMHETDERTSLRKKKEKPNEGGKHHISNRTPPSFLPNAAETSKVGTGKASVRVMLADGGGGHWSTRGKPSGRLTGSVSWPGGSEGDSWTDRNSDHIFQT